MVSEKEKIMKQVCPLYRVQFKNGIILAIDRQTDRQTDRRRSSVFFARPKNPYVKKSRLFLSDYTRIKGVFFVMFYDWKGGIRI